MVKIKTTVSSEHLPEFTIEVRTYNEGTKAALQTTKPKPLQEFIDDHQEFSPALAELTSAMAKYAKIMHNRDRDVNEIEYREKGYHDSNNADS